MIDEKLCVLSSRQFNEHGIYITSRYPMDVPVVSLEICKIWTRVCVKRRSDAIWMTSISGNYISHTTVVLELTDEHGTCSRDFLYDCCSQMLRNK